MQSMNRKSLLFLVLAGAMVVLTTVSCSKDRVIIGFWQQASDYLTYIDTLGIEHEKNLTDSAVTLYFRDADTVFLSYGKKNPLLSMPPYLLTDSLRDEIADLHCNLSKDTLPYTLSENTLTIGTQEYGLEKLKGRWMTLSVTDTMNGREARREITFYKPRK